MRFAIYNMMIGAGVLAMLTIHYQTAPPVVTKEEIIDAFAMVLDGDNLREVDNVPIPRRKPLDGYTEDFREYMTMLFAENM